jgi:membrane protein
VRKKETVGWSLALDGSILWKKARRMISFINVVKRFFLHLYKACTHWQKDEAAVMAAATSYYMALSFFPLFLILVSGLGFILEFSGWGIDVQQRLMKVLADNVSPSLADQVKAALSSVKTNAMFNGPVGLITLLIAAMAVFAYVEGAFDRIWDITSNESIGIFKSIKNILWQRFRAFLFLIGIGGLVIAAFFFNMTLSIMENYASEYFVISSTFWRMLQFISAVALNWLLFTLIYKFLPKAPVKWTCAAGGGLLASIIWEIGRRILAVFVIGSHYSVYGIIGAFIAIMLWVYYAAATVFFGAEFVHAIGKK